MKKNNLLPKLFISLVTISLLGCISGITYAWFSRQNNVNLDSIYQGTSAGAYFAYGSGTQDDPYGISEPRHLYNLAWLQYLGQFNEDTNKDGKIDSQYYFELASDIDMQGLVLPPIGTKDNPFIGNFDGKKYTVSNLTISNSIDSDNITNYPYTVTDDFNNNKPEVIGFFGVVGYLPADESKYSLGSVTVESGTDTTEEPINQVHDLYLNNITVKNTSDKLLAGFLAGYVNGSMTNCGVHYCDFDIASGTTNIEDLSTSVSKYSYVGAINTDKYKIDGDTSGGGQDNDWGGSVDMLSLNRRINYIGTYMYSSGNVSNNTFSSKTYGLDAKFNNSNTEYVYWNYKSSSPGIYYIQSGTHLPLNIDKQASGLVDENNEVTTDYEIERNITSNNKTYTWHSTNLYLNNAPETLINNSAYIIGGTSNIPFRRQALDSGSYGGIYKSFGETTKANVMETYDSKQAIELLTIQSKTTYRIKDDYNANNSSTAFSYTQRTANQLNLAQYPNVIRNFNSSMKGSYNLHGFHMVGDSHTGRATYSANFFNEEISSYEFVTSGLNFTLQKSGYLSTIVGAYFAGNYNGNETLFDIYHITRDSEHKVQSAQLINHIYKKTDGSPVYQYSDNTYSDSSITSTSGLTDIMDFTYLSRDSSKPLVSHAAYYFEMPLIAGDYVIGASSSNSLMAYLMYLDIGANASSESGEDDKDTLTIDFVWATSDPSSVIALIKITDEAYVKSEVVLEITSDTSTTAKRSYFYYKRIAPVSSGTSSTFSYVYYYGDSEGLKIENIGTDGNAVAQPSKDAVENG